jgi:glucose/mannose-6-phosphate isomerase
MLDQADYIARFDKEDMMGVISRQHLQLDQKFEIAGLEKFEAISNIVLSGMGGSALEGEFVKNWLADRLPVPFEIVRGYTLPSYVGEDTLLIASSYSGNTEETLEALEQAEVKGAQIVIFTAGGKLAERAAEQNYPHYVMPSGLQPRVAVCYGVKALTDLFTELGLIQSVKGELSEAVEFMKESIKTWGADTATDENPAKQLANELLGHEIVMYGGPSTAVASLKWKINFNETSKNLAFYYNYPEFNHNEFMGWSHPQKTNIKVIELLSDLDHPQIAKRFEISNRLLSGTMPAPIMIQAKGENKLQQMLWIQTLGDFVSVYLGCLNGIDPTPVPLIEKLKIDLVK